MAGGYLRQGRSQDSRKKEVVATMGADGRTGVKRAYFRSMEDHSGASLQGIFKAHISAKAKVTTDRWTGHLPLKGTYRIRQVKSGTGNVLFQMSTIVHQVKAWLRSVFSWMDKGHIEKYLNGFSYRLNRSVHKENIFDLLINRMISSEHVGYQQIKLSI